MAVLVCTTSAAGLVLGVFAGAGRTEQVIVRGMGAPRVG